MKDKGSYGDGDFSKKEDKRTLIKIGKLSQLTGLSRQRIHYYIMLGLIREDARTAGGHRLFSSDAIRKIRLIRELNESGYTLTQIREMFSHRLIRRS